MSTRQCSVHLHGQHQFLQQLPQVATVSSASFQFAKRVKKLDHSLMRAASIASLQKGLTRHAHVLWVPKFGNTDLSLVQDLKAVGIPVIQTECRCWPVRLSNE